MDADALKATIEETEKEFMTQKQVATEEEKKERVKNAIIWVKWPLRVNS